MAHNGLEDTHAKYTQELAHTHLWAPEHDLEIGVLEAALNSDAHFIGAMGSRKTHATREAAFKTRKTARTFSDIVGPVGLDIGATDPNEIALSVLAQIVERRRQA